MVIRVFPGEAAIVRLVGAIQLEQNDEWAVQRRRYMTQECVAPLSDDPIVGLPTWPPDRSGPAAAAPRAGTCATVGSAGTRSVFADRRIPGLGAASVGKLLVPASGRLLPGRYSYILSFAVNQGCYDVYT